MTAGAFVGAGGYEVFGHGRAIKGAVDHQCPLAIGLPAELGCLVVHHERVAERPHGQVEVLGPALGIAPVRSQVPSRPAPAAHLGQQPRPGASWVLSRLAERQRQGEVGEGRHRPRRAGPSSRSWLRGPRYNLAQRFALRPGPLPVVAFSHVPAPVGVAGSRSPGAPTGPGTTAAPGWRPGRPSRRSRQARRQSTLSPTPRAGLRPISPRLLAWLQPRPRSIFFAWLPAHYREHPVFWLCRGVDEREHQVEQVTHLAVTGQESLPP